MAKLHWENLTKEERAEYMRLQMSPQGRYDRSGYLPMDCGYCGVCDALILGAGWCKSCMERWKELRRKLEYND